MPQIKISGFVGPELQFLRDSCNFTPDERLFFNLRAEGWDLTGVKTRMDADGRSWSESKISDLSKAVQCKIRRIIEQFSDDFRGEKRTF